jgi:hypothetical protein
MHNITLNKKFVGIDFEKRGRMAKEEHRLANNRCCINIEGRGVKTKE